MGLSRLQTSLATTFQRTQRRQSTGYHVCPTTTTIASDWSIWSIGCFGAKATAVYGDQLATGANAESEEIATRITWEVKNHVAIQRRTEWLASMKIMASALQQASDEKVAICDERSIQSRMQRTMSTVC